MMNKVILVGRVGKDPETRQLQSGSVSNFSLATGEKYTDKNGQKQETTEWHNVSVFGKLSEIVEKYVNKGDLLYVEGKLKTRSWEKDGIKHYATDVVLDYNGQLKMLGSKNQNESQNNLSNEEQNNSSNEEQNEADDFFDSKELPF